MLDQTLRDHLLDGVAVIIATVSPAGLPVASRGYGVAPVSDTVVDVFLDAGETELIDHVRSSGRLAVTTGNIFTFKSVQFKGAVEAIDAATADQHDTAVELLGRHFARVARLQNTPTTMLERRMPTSFVTCVVRIDEIFDQSPGPKAGTALVRPA